MPFVPSAGRVGVLLLAGPRRSSGSSAPPVCAVAVPRVVRLRPPHVVEPDQILTVAVDCLPMYHSSNGILTAVAKTAVDGICQ